MGSKMKIILVLLLGVSLIYNIYMHSKYNDYINQNQDKNYSYLENISLHGINLANRLEEFIKLPIEIENDETKRKLDNPWRNVIGENKSIHVYLGGISPQYMNDQSSDWDLVRYSLFRVDGLLHGMTIKFLEQRSYSLTSEEIEQLEAIVAVHRIIGEETEDKPINLKSIIESITEPMMIIDPHFSKTLERINN